MKRKIRKDIITELAKKGLEFGKMPPLKTNIINDYDDIHIWGKENCSELLDKAKQIDKMYSKVTKDGITLVALKLYFNDKNMIKVEVATAQGKKLHDKRDDLKIKSLKRESEQALKAYK